MPRSRSPSPHCKSRSIDQSSRQPKKSSDKYRSSASRPRRSQSPSAQSHKSCHISPSDRTRSRRSSRSPQSKHRRSSRSSSKYKKSSSRGKNYNGSSRRRSRSRDSSYRRKSSKEQTHRRRRRESSSSSSSSSSNSSSSSSRSSSSRSRSNSPNHHRPSTQNNCIPLSANKGFALKSRSSELPPHNNGGVRQTTTGLTQSLFKLSVDHSTINHKLPKRSTTDSPPRSTIFASVDQMLEDPIMPDTLDHINADGFVSRSFVSKKASDKVIIDLDRETVTISGVKKKDDIDEIDAIFYPNVSARVKLMSDILNFI